MPSKFVWIRHAEKQYCNNKGPLGCHQHDSPIRPESIDKIYSKVDFLVKEFGYPTHIYFSPFLRTRETKDYMLSKLKEINEKEHANIDIDSEIKVCEYLGFQRPVGEIADIEYETQKNFKQKVTLGESMKSLNQRVKEHMYSLSLDKSKDKCVWIITHGIIVTNVLYNLLMRYNVKKKNIGRPSSLSYVYFENKLPESIENIQTDVFEKDKIYD
jgi:broad specificity phosphatase PhoE